MYDPFSAVTRGYRLFEEEDSIWVLYTAFWCPTDDIYIALFVTPPLLSNVYACSSEGYGSMILGCTWVDVHVLTGRFGARLLGDSWWLPLIVPIPSQAC